MIDYDRVPQELKDLKRWMLWNYNAKGTKIPLQSGGEAAKSNDPSTWTDFDSAVETAFLYQGIATVIAEPYTGIDLDNCIKEDGSIS